MCCSNVCGFCWCYHNKIAGMVVGLVSKVIYVEITNFTVINIKYNAYPPS